MKLKAYIYLLILFTVTVQALPTYKTDFILIDTPNTNGESIHFFFTKFINEIMNSTDKYVEANIEILQDNVVVTKEGV